MFALDSLPVNMYFLYLAWRFYRHSDSSSSRKLFRMSLAHLPIVMILMLIHKKKENGDDWLLSTLRGLSSSVVATGVAGTTNDKTVVETLNGN